MCCNYYFPGFISSQIFLWRRNNHFGCLFFFLHYSSQQTQPVLAAVRAVWSCSLQLMEGIQMDTPNLVILAQPGCVSCPSCCCGISGTLKCCRLSHPQFLQLTAESSRNSMAGAERPWIHLHSSNQSCHPPSFLNCGTHSPRRQ